MYREKYIFTDLQITYSGVLFKGGVEHILSIVDCNGNNALKV